MPGFFFSYLLLAAALAWTRYLAATRGPPWLVWSPAPGFLVWLLAFVYASASMYGGADPALEFEANELRLRRTYDAAWVAQWGTVLTLSGVVLLTVWVYLRPAHEAREGGEQA